MNETLYQLDLKGLIAECLKAYTDDSIPSSIEPPSSMALPIASLVCSSPPQYTAPQSPEPEEAPRNRNGKFICTECTNVYSGRRQLVRHLKSHKEPTKYACTFHNCPQTSYRIDSMRSHIKAHDRRMYIEHEWNNNLGKFVCPECNHVYGGKRQLVRHLRSHKEPKKYTCTVTDCFKTSHRIDAIRSHIKVHERQLLVEQEHNSYLLNPYRLVWSRPEG